MEAGVYAYIDAATAKSKVDLQIDISRQQVIGVISGYLMKSAPKKGRVSLDARSCKLIAFIAPGLKRQNCR